jgi:perosamine synthetase
MDRLMELAAHHQLEVIEDAAEALSMEYKGRSAGTFGRFGTFSFFANKTITCGEGGIVLCKTQEDFNLLYRIKNHGRDRKGIFIHENIGYNFCFTDLQAAVGVAQLRKLDRIMQGKNRIFARYRDAFKGREGITLVEHPPEVTSNHWFINVLVDDPAGLSAHLEAGQIGSRRYFYPLSLQPCYADLDVSPCPNSLWLYEHGLSLPSGALLSDGQVDKVIESVLNFVGG